MGKDASKEEKIVVYDLGGTFDLNLRVVMESLVKSTNGDTHLVEMTLTSALSTGWSTASKRDRLTSLKIRWPFNALKRPQKAKVELSSTKDTSINLPYITADASGPKHLMMDLSRARFEQMVSDLVERSRKPCLNALKDAGLSPQDIDEVILVGGSTRMPAVQAIVKDLPERTPQGVNPDEVVAMGAAIQGGILGGGIKMSSYSTLPPSHSVLRLSVELLPS